MDIAKAIVTIRERKGIKQMEIASSLGIDQSNYSRLEKRGSKLTIEQLQSIGDALGVSLIELLTWGEEKPDVGGAADLLAEIERLRGEEEKSKKLIARYENIIDGLFGGLARLGGNKSVNLDAGLVDDFEKNFGAGLSDSAKRLGIPLNEEEDDQI